MTAREMRNDTMRRLMNRFETNNPNLIIREMWANDVCFMRIGDDFIMIPVSNLTDSENYRYLSH